MAQAPCHLDIDDVLTVFSTSRTGLSDMEASERLARYGYNVLPKAKPPHILAIFISQFFSPLIYILLFAAGVSLFMSEITDAFFILVVLLINAFIGTAQEYSAQRAASSLQKMVANNVSVLRNGTLSDINGEKLVPGDIIHLESGDKIPSDVRFIDVHDLEVDESLLTGESEPVVKSTTTIKGQEEVTISERNNMGFAGTIVTRGRAIAVVVSTGDSTELGTIAQVVHSSSEKTPLLIRMDKFTMFISTVMLAIIGIIFIAGIAQGNSWGETFLLSAALAVAAIPEGLPIAMTITLAAGMKRMTKRNVIVRKLIAVESLGSCTVIASDKTGTLTVNKMTVKQLVLPNDHSFQIQGEGINTNGHIIPEGKSSVDDAKRLCLHSILANEATLVHEGEQTNYTGDMVDVAFLVLADKMQLDRTQAKKRYSELASIPYESHNAFAAGLYSDGKESFISAKGSMEKLLTFCSHMASETDDIPIDKDHIKAQANELAKQGFRVIAIATKQAPSSEELHYDDLHGMTFLGLVGMIDPLRPEAKDSIQLCQSAGIDVMMVTGDNPVTALAIARELQFCDSPDHVVTGQTLRHALEKGQEEFDYLISQSKVFARVEPLQKQQIVASLIRQGHFVAVTGDGVNDAPALHDAHVGVAMGKSGTDVARESAEIIVTDDNFSSIVSGVEEGRIIYNNIRKVISFLLSTNSAEILLFILCIIAGLPMPLLAVQILWLNIATEGIQHIALAFEKSEGHELRVPPRSPKEPIFNRIMLERIMLPSILMAGISFFFFKWMLANNYSLESARNTVLLLLVLFENFQVLNNRSERLSIFQQSLWSNPLLIFSIVLAQAIHIIAMYTPGLSDVLHIHPVSLSWWGILLVTTLSLLCVSELHKYVRKQ